MLCLTQLPHSGVLWFHPDTFDPIIVEDPTRAPSPVLQWTLDSDLPAGDYLEIELLVGRLFLWNYVFIQSRPHLSRTHTTLVECRGDLRSVARVKFEEDLQAGTEVWFVSQLPWSFVEDGLRGPQGLLHPILANVTEGNRIPLAVQLRVVGATTHESSLDPHTMQPEGELLAKLYHAFPGLREYVQNNSLLNSILPGLLSYLKTPGSSPLVRQLFAAAGKLPTNTGFAPNVGVDPLIR